MRIEEFTKYIRRCGFDMNDEECDCEWKWYGTLTFQSPSTRYRARRLFFRLLGDVKKDAEPGLLNWFAVFEDRRWDKGIRLHTLVGGSHVCSKAHWSLHWRELGGGKASIFDYDPGAFAPYALKEVRAGSFFEITCDMCGWGPVDFDRD